MLERWWLILQKWFWLSGAVKTNLNSFWQNKLSALQTLDLSPLKLSFIIPQKSSCFKSQILVNLLISWLALTLPTSHFKILKQLWVSVANGSFSFYTIWCHYSQFTASPFGLEEIYFSNVDLSTKGACFLQLFVLQRYTDD